MGGNVLERRRVLGQQREIPGRRLEGVDPGIGIEHREIDGRGADVGADVDDGPHVRDELHFRIALADEDVADNGAADVVVEELEGMIPAGHGNGRGHDVGGRRVHGAASQCAISTGIVASASTCRVTPPRMIWRTRPCV